MEPKPRKGAAPSSVLRHLPDLKLNMVSESHLSAVYHYFFDHFGENDESMQMGVQTSSPMLGQVLTEIARSLFEENIRKLKQSRIIRIPDRGFLHGSCIFKDRVASFFYFEDIDIGMAAFLRRLGARSTAETN